MYPIRDPITGLYGFAAGDEWSVGPSFVYAYPFSNGQAVVEQREGEYSLFSREGVAVSLQSIADRIVSSARVVDVSPGDGGKLKNIACRMVVDHGRERSFVVVDGGLNARVLRTIPKSARYTFSSSGCWMMLEVDEAGVRKHWAYDSRTVAEIVLPLFKSYHPSDDGHWVVAALNSDDDSDSDVVTLGETDRFAFFAIKDLEVISEWYPEAQGFSDGLGLLRNSAGQSVFVDHDMKPVDELVFDYADPFRHGLAYGDRDGETGYFGKDGKLAIRVDQGWGQKFDRFGRAVVLSRDEQCGDLIDRQGNVVVSEMVSCDFFDGDYPYYEISHEHHALGENALCRASDLSPAVTL